MVTTPNFDLDIDTTLGGNNASDYIIPSQKAIKSYVDNNTGTTVDQTYDGTSTNAQSGVAINGAGFVKNTATNPTGSITLLGSATSGSSAVNIGVSSTASSYCAVLGANATTGGFYSTAIGCNASTSSTNSTAVGYWATASYKYATAVGNGATASADTTVAVGTSSVANYARATSIGQSSNATADSATALGAIAKATANNAIQIGYGTNNTASTLSVGFYNNSSTHYNWQLLDGTTGLIPDARISTNIARTSAIPDISTKQDTLVSGTNIKTINNTSVLGSGNIDTSEIFVANGTTRFDEISNAIQDGKFVIYHASNVLYTLSNTSSTKHQFSRVISLYNDDIRLEYFTIDDTNAWSYSVYTVADTDLSNLSSTGKTVIDGQWVEAYLEIVSSDTNMTAGWSHDYSVSSYLPSDNYNYEVLVGAVGQSSATSGQTLDVRIGSDIIGKDSSNKALMFLLRITPRSSARVQTKGCVVLPIGTGRQIKIQALTNPGILSALRVFGYRRIGTNT